MDFLDLLQKYKYGNASEEEIKLVEEEIRKHEAIEDYLSESYDIDFEKDNQEDINKETATVKKSVNKKLRKVILSSVVIVFSIIFIIFYIISPVINSFYYNPSAKTMGKYQEDIYYDLIAFTELNLPGYGLLEAASEKLGFGDYNIYFHRINLFTGEEKDINEKIKKNIRAGSFTDFYTTDYFRFDSIRTSNKDKYFIEEQNKKVINHIRKLNSVSYISAYVIFKNDLDMKELYDLVEKYNNKISFKWAGVRTGNPDKPINYLSGFNPNLSDSSVTTDIADKSKYPFLQLGDCMTSGYRDSTSIIPAAYSAHYTSLLMYMSDRQKAVKALDISTAKTDYYKNALSYVQKNGIRTYGVLVYCEARDLLEFINDEKLSSIEIDNVLASKKYIN